MVIRIYNLLHSFVQPRFIFMWPVLITCMIVFALTRIILSFLTPDSGELGLLSVLNIYLIGSLNDITFLFFAMIPVGIYILILPDRLWNTKYNRYIIYLICFLIVFALLFTMTVEIIFWHAFQERVSFFVADNFIYIGDMLNMITASYPVNTILSFLLILSVLIYKILAKQIKSSFNSEGSFLDRATFLTSLALLPLLSSLIITTELISSENNQYLSELSINGPFQLILVMMDYKAG